LAEEKYLEEANSNAASPEPTRIAQRDSTLVATNLLLSNLGTHKKVDLRPKISNDQFDDFRPSYNQT